jgi:hypothetical protein
MKISNALFVAALMTASVSAMAQDGAMRVDQQMDAARTVAMQSYDAKEAKAQVAKQEPRNESNQTGTASISNQQG